MRLFLSLLICFTGYVSAAAHIDVAELRALYYQANEDKQYSELLYNRLRNVGEESAPLLVCYKGMALLMQAKHSYNPYQKLSKFKKGTQLLEQAVRRDSNNMEIRFMRFCVQSQAPGMLGYSGNLNGDKELLIKSWRYLSDADLKEKIKAYMLKYGQCSVSEKMSMQ